MHIPLSTLQLLPPPLIAAAYKGQAGKIGVLGGCALAEPRSKANSYIKLCQVKVFDCINVFFRADYKQICERIGQKITRQYF